MSVYRNRLLAAGIIKTAGYGKVDFAAPYLREYLREHAAHLVMEGVAAADGRSSATRRGRTGWTCTVSNVIKGLQTHMRP